MQTRRDVLQSVAVAIGTVAAAKSASAALTENGKTWCVSIHPHFDRVMGPWAIKRFVDKDAKFVFATSVKIEDAVKGAIPIGFTTGELSMHDDKGTCYHKVLVKYQLLNDPALVILDRVNKALVDWDLSKTPVDMTDQYARWSFGLLGLANAILVIAKNDQEALDRGFANFDALYQYITAELKKGDAKKS